jgi:hypothetical protein
MGGGKGGSTTSKVEIPKWLEDAAQENLARGRYVSGLGYAPYYGPDVAAQTPLQVAANQGVSSAAGAFGLPGGGLSMGTEGMPTQQTFAGGVQGYSSGGLYDQAVQELQLRRPGQYNAMTDMFINPYTGAAPQLSFGPTVAPLPPMASNPLLFPAGSERPERSGRAADMAAGRSVTGIGGGYTGLRDMVDGGGPGKSGSTFSGGGRISGIANAAGISPRGSK